MPYIIIGSPCFQKYADQLAAYGFTVVLLPSDHGLNAAVSTHADTLVFSDGFVYIMNVDFCEGLPEELRQHFTAVSDRPYGGYPTDTAFNALCIGRHMFARLQSLAPSVRKYAEETGFTLVNVRQGYARCSTLALPGARAAVTADEGMAAAMESVGIEVLRIRPGHIALDGCEYGFIGGASFVYEPRNCCSISHRSRSVYFFGDLSRHPDGQVIAGFLAHRGYDAVSLGGELTDFGGAVVM